MSYRNYLRRAYRTVLPLLYGRTHFKAFLKSSIGEIDLRVRQLASIADYFSGALRPIRIKPPFGDAMLVIAPHQDDEIIGCGGALALQVRSRRPAFVVVLHDGADEHASVGLGRGELSQLRNEESRRAAAALGSEQPRFLGYSDLAGRAREAAGELVQIIERNRVDTIFVPFLLDAHPHHRQANYILAESLREIRSNIRVFGYEVWSFCIPNVAVVIDDVAELKFQALSQFAFANQAVDYVWTTKGINMYRSRLLEVGTCRYAECFFEIPRQEYIELVANMQRIETGIKE